jgi:hypothetical protein
LHQGSSVRFSCDNIFSGEQGSTKYHDHLSSLDRPHRNQSIALDQRWSHFKSRISPVFRPIVTNQILSNPPYGLEVDHFLSWLCWPVIFAFAFEADSWTSVWFKSQPCLNWQTRTYLGSGRRLNRHSLSPLALQSISLPLTSLAISWENMPSR